MLEPLVEHMTHCCSVRKYMRSQQQRQRRHDGSRIAAKNKITIVTEYMGNVTSTSSLAGLANK